MIYRLLAAILTGILLTLSFPAPAFYPLVFVALVPLFLAVKGQGWPRAFGLALLSGSVHLSTLLYWLAGVMHRFGGFPWPAAVSLLLLLALYLSLFMALPVALGEGRNFFERPSLRASLGLALFWTLGEILRGAGSLGFPWEPLGAALAPAPPLLRPAAYLTVYGLSFLLVGTNFLIFMACTRRRWGLLSAVVFFWLGVYAWGLMTIPRHPPSLPLSLCLVQGNVPQEIKWNPGEDRRNLYHYLSLSRKALSATPRLIVWPETALTFVYPVSPLVQALQEGVRELGIPVLFGVPRVERTLSGWRLKNSAVVLAPSGEVLGIYDKEHLVPFGEYVPLVRWFPWLRKLAVASGNYAPGTGPGVIRIKGVRLGLLICFENAFPFLARKRVREGADLLVVLTNDAWFGSSAALPQHFYQSVLRAVETRRYVLQVANTGISGLIDPYGRILSRGPINREWIACWER